jgi:hypothetical protein
MLANLPADFADVEQADHIAQSKAELEVVQAEKQALQAKISEMESNFRKQYMQLLSSQAAPAVEEKVEEAPKEEKTTKTYRCLDCGEDFKTSIQLATHKRTKHKGD